MNLIILRECWLWESPVGTRRSIQEVCRGAVSSQAVNGVPEMILGLDTCIFFLDFKKFNFQLIFIEV